ncbi:DUF5686 and carboxypeptidase-like regulatory domain-containing protein [Tellurirhabdus bombi]|uniref:DUF5686 and carboxypeptidase-like regulatory domain-containing protein n=1 Tax=Tellurirhabdus bombi TaxID=2907205 RepID=UPI001F41A8D0|nr:DUF5686 and carboxypeptidase-like regulatory domain-containing protein [Tellurirhabdus bombi]
MNAITQYVKNVVSCHNPFKKSRLTPFYSLILLLNANVLFGQAPTQTISGQITEAGTGQAVPFASVAVKGKPIGTQADAEGNYQLILRQAADSLLVSAMGFQTITVPVNPQQITQIIPIKLTPVAAQLQEVVVRAGENPAYGILRKVIAHRSQNDFQQLAGYEYQAYSQLAISISEMSEKFRKRKPVQAIMKALQEKQAGKEATTVPIFLSETVSQVYARHQPQRQKEQILKTNITSAGLTDDSFIAMFTGAGFNTLNFYGKQVSLFKKEFISPLAEGGRAAYKYFLADTAQIGQHVCYEIDFDPKNKRDLVMQGKMWIDTLSYALVQIDAHVGAEANINFIRGVDIEQTYETVDDAPGAWLPEVTRLTISVDEVVKNTFGATVDYMTSVREPQVGAVKDLDFFDTEVEMAEDRAESSADYWQAQRQAVPQSEASDATRATLNAVRDLPLIKAYSRAAQFVLNGGNIPLGRGIEAGSVFSLWAYNPVEGHRLQVGLKTSNQFSRNWQLSAYGAYGTRDRIWKASSEIVYIPSRKPLTIVTLKNTYDLEQLGVRMEDLAENPFLRFANRFGPYPQAYYQHESLLTVQRDFGPNFTHTVGLRYHRFNPAFPFAIQLPAAQDSQPLLINEFWGTEAFLEARYAPGRLPSRRVPARRLQRRATESAPVITMRYTYGTSSSFQGQVIGDYHKFQLKLDHALRWGLLGRTQYTLQARYTPSTIPYPLLQVHLGNQTPFHNRNAYNLMNYAEFVSDRYVSLALEHKFEGLLTNRLPMIRRWGWRNFVTGKVLWGTLSEANRGLIATQSKEGLPLQSINSLKKEPYVEVGYGIENIFRLVRVEALHRLTYRQSPGVTPFAVKVSFQLSL